MRTEFALERSQRSWSVRIALAMILAPGISAAVEIESELTVGVAVTDNVGRTVTNKIEDTIRMIGIDFDLVHASRKLNASIISSFNYLDYANDTFNSEIVGGFVLEANYAIVDERLIWDLTYNWGQQLQDVFAPASPTNREDVFLLTTGPTYTQPLGARNYLELGLVYTNATYETRPLDFESGGVSLQLAREIQSGKFISVNATTARVEFEDSQFFPFDMANVFLSFDSESGRNIIEIDAGYAEVKSEGESGSGPLFRADWIRNVAATTSLQLGIGTQYSDQGDIFRFFQNYTGNLGSAGSISTFGSPFRQDFAVASIDYVQDRTALALGVIYSSEDYELEPNNLLDRDYVGLNLQFDREISRRLFARLRAQFRTEDFATRNRIDRNRTAALTLGFQFSPAFNLSVTYLYYRRDSTAIVNDVIENRVMVQFGYAPRWGR